MQPRRLREALQLVWGSEWRREEGRKRKPRRPAALGQAVGRNSVGYSCSILNTSQYLVHADDRSVKVVDWWSKMVKEDMYRQSMLCV